MQCNPVRGQVSNFDSLASHLCSLSPPPPPPTPTVHSPPTPSDLFLILCQEKNNFSLTESWRAITVMPGRKWKMCDRLWISAGSFHFFHLCLLSNFNMHPKLWNRGGPILNATEQLLLVCLLPNHYLTSMSSRTHEKALNLFSGNKSCGCKSCLPEHL